MLNQQIKYHKVKNKTTQQKHTQMQLQEFI